MGDADKILEQAAERHGAWLASMIDVVVAAAPRLREVGVARVSVKDIAFELSPTPPGKPLTEAEQSALEARLHKLEQERAARDEEDRRRTQLAAAGGFRRRG